MQRTPEFMTYGMFIGGEWVAADGGETLDSVDPATEQVIGRFPAGGAADVGRAADAARSAAPGWRDLRPMERAKLLREFASRLEQHEEELAELDARDSGNPISAMLDDVRGAVRELHMFAGLVTELKGTSVANGPSQFTYSLREPYGVVGRIIPFNHPLKFATGKLAAPLIAGNACVLKPAEQTSLSALRMAEIVGEIFPPGVLNVVTGRGREAGAALASDPRIPRVAFTGSVPSGRDVMSAGAESIKHVTLELGGKNPMIVLPDVDIPDAVEGVIRGMNLPRVQGQSCQSNSRVFVHRDIAEPFVDALVGGIEKLRVGSPLDYETDVGPLAFREHFERVRGYVEAGKREGATVATGGDRAQDPGFFLEPTLFTDVKDDMSIAQEEIFGPVVSLMEWSETDEVVRRANSVPYGLTANIWTNDLRAAHRLAHRIESGLVWINGKGKRVPGTPFGGFKSSGVGKEDCLEEMLSYTQEKVVNVNV